MENNTLIISGGDIEEKFFCEILKNNKFNNIIASDRGLEILHKYKIEPSHIIGDFDSINTEILNKYINKKNIQIERLNPEKDYTDTHMAVKLAIKLKSTNIIILGAIGTRIDHTIANIHVLKETLDANIKCSIINERNEIQLIDKTEIIELNSHYKYISLIPLTTKVEGVTLQGLKYTLNNATLEIGHSIGVSNEQKAKIAKIEIKKGILIIIKSKD